MAEIILDFGKYEGSPLSTIYEEDPQYVLWLRYTYDHDRRTDLLFSELCGYQFDSDVPDKYKDPTLKTTKYRGMTPQEAIQKFGPTALNALIKYYEECPYKYRGASYYWLHNNGKFMNKVADYRRSVSI